VAVFRLAAYLLAAALMTALAVVESPPDEVAVLVETDFEIPPLAYYDGRGFRPVHVAYVGEWEEAYWVGANAPVRIPTWNFKKAVIYLPREALRAKAPPDAKGGVLRIYLNQTVVELVEAPPEVVATYSYLKPDEVKAPKAKAEWIRPPTRKPLDKDLIKEDLDKGGEDRQPSSYQTTQSTPAASPDGAPGLVALALAGFFAAVALALLFGVRRGVFHYSWLVAVVWIYLWNIVGGLLSMPARLIFGGRRDVALAGTAPAHPAYALAVGAAEAAATSILGRSKTLVKRMCQAAPPHHT
jgi:hypothetical protein